MITTRNNSKTQKNIVKSSLVFSVIVVLTLVFFSFLPSSIKIKFQDLVSFWIWGSILLFVGFTILRSRKVVPIHSIFADSALEILVLKFLSRLSKSKKLMPTYSGKAANTTGYIYIFLGALLMVLGILNNLK